MLEEKKLHQFKLFTYFGLDSTCLSVSVAGESVTLDGFKISYLVTSFRPGLAHLAVWRPRLDPMRVVPAGPGRVCLVGRGAVRLAACVPHEGLLSSQRAL